MDAGDGFSAWELFENPKISGAADVAANVASMQDPDLPEQFRKATVITVMKNPARLRRVRDLIDQLPQHGVDLAQLPVLVIDDEADQAGLNAAVGDDDVSATYEAILELRDALPRHTYLMYTATPQANLLINLADVLSPDFVSVLTPGQGYTGGKYFFETHRDRFVRRLTPSQAQEALSATTEPPETLKRALASYYLARAQRDKGRMSMLVHPSHTQDLQGTYGAFVKTLSSAWKLLLATPGPDRDELVAEIFDPAFQDLVDGGAVMKPLESLLTGVRHWIGATRIKVVNSQADVDSEVNWSASPSWVLVGGNKLDRGFTVEGLTTTYMPRAIGAGQVDTVQQRARFFGYKSAYADLCRAWLNADTAMAFEHYVHHEKLLRRELVEADAAGISLKQWKRKMLLDPTFKPTRKAVIDIDYFHDRVRGDRWMSMDRVPAAAGSRGGALEGLWSKVAGAAEVDGRDGRSGEHRNKRAAVPMQLVVRAILDWVTPEDGSPAVPAREDVALLNQVALLLQARVDEDPSLTVDLYSMDDGQERSRTPNAGGSVDLPTGRSASYKGDDHFWTEGVTSLQLHRVTVIGQHRSMLGVRFRVPRALAGGVLVQA
ncbi:Z1 domain-containing protein [Nocardioides sp. GY 10127]|uniref:Z1 domain-containing protein n=1 Tax=Nocardioides sp. GY 10127 TaxID=2569762 RepID=UPI001F0EFBCD|nr:Z1 domain-containing protein [Nocardioides sp. GY 10127]